MPVHNAAPFLDESVRSIVSQSFDDLEFVIRDDGSTDGSLGILRSWAGRDRRIKLFEGRRLGPSGSSNWVVESASAPFIARMDADDIAYPDRLRRQFEILRSSPDIALLGTMFNMVDRRGKILRPYDFSRLARCGYSAPFPHSSIMFRRDAFRRIGGYRPACEYWEDLDLYLRMAEQGQIGVLAEPLVAYRAHQSTRLTSDRDSVERCLGRRYRCVEAHRISGSYDSLVVGPGDSDGEEKCHPRTFIALGSVELWSGGTPDMLRPLIERGNLKWNLPSAFAIAWTLWARVSPASLRWMLTAMVRLRNLAFERRVIPGQVYEWNPRYDPDRTGFARAIVERSVRKPVVPVAPASAG